MSFNFRKTLVKAAVTVVVALGVTQPRMPSAAGTRGIAQAAVRPAPVDAPVSYGGRVIEPKSEAPIETASSDDFEPKIVLMRSASWFVYPRGCEALKDGFDLALHFHGAHSTVIPRYLKSRVNAVLVIINKGIGSGAYSNALALKSQVNSLLERVEVSIAKECELPRRSPKRLALSSWSAGYGATQQFLRWRPELVDAVLLSDGLHVGFTNARRRTVRVTQMQEFASFARQAAGRSKLMAIAHSAITPPDYAGAGETAMALAEVVHAPRWPLSEKRYGMTQLTAARRGHFYVDGYAGGDKAAHARHLYSIHHTSFARLREYWAG
jgi:hypothetical protein